jgi:endonuclease YncB( thermonuclease family)
MSRRLLCFAAWLPLACMAAGADPPAQPRTLAVRVVSIADGDTITVEDPQRIRHKVRLVGIDAPEDGQAFGDRSTQHLSRLLAGGIARIEWSKKDQYDRLLAKVTVQDAGHCAPTPCPSSIDVGLAQVSAGMAWHYRDYQRDQAAVDRAAYADAERRARAARRGLWADQDPVAPSAWRRMPANGPVKKSRNDICHDVSSPGYKATTHFEAFATLAACLESGGRRPGAPRP